MKIKDKKVINESRTEYKFDNGAWVCIDIDDDYGSWEYQECEDDEETYYAGGLWFEGKELFDYDGCFELQEEVKLALWDLGYSFEDEDKRLR